MRTTVIQLKANKQKGEKIAMLTAYDYMTEDCDNAGVPLILFETA